MEAETTNNTELESRKEDLKFLVKKLEEIHPDPYRHINQAKEFFEKSLEKSLEVENEYFILAIQESLALLGDLHTGVTGILEEPLSTQYVSINDAFYITRSNEANPEMLTAKLLGINGHDLQEIIPKISKLSSNESLEVLQKDLSAFLQCNKILRYYGFSNSEEVTIQTDKGDFKVKQNESRGETREPLLWTEDQKNNKTYIGNNIYQARIEANCLLFQYNKCSNKGHNDEELSSFKKDLLENSQKAKNIIVDLRLNKGGNTDIMEDLFEKLPNDKKIYVAMGKSSTSSAIHHIVYLKTNKNAILIGETAGQRTRRFGNKNDILLPNSKIKMIFSSKDFDLLPEEKSDILEPDIKIPVTIEDYVNNSDPLNKWVEKI